MKYAAIAASSLLTFFTSSTALAHAILPRQAATTPVPVSLLSPQVVYNGNWENAVSPCDNNDSLARRSGIEQTRAVSVVVNLAHDHNGRVLTGFTVAMQASPRTKYTIRSSSATSSFTASDDADKIVNSTAACDSAAQHFFNDPNNNNHTVIITLDTEAPGWIQINKITAMYTEPQNSEQATGSASSSLADGGIAGALLCALAALSQLL